MGKKLSNLKPRLATAAGSRLTLAQDGEAGRVARRGTAAERGYDEAWRKASLAHRAAHPFCAYCALEGVMRVVDLVDHLYPHGIRRGRRTRAQMALFRLTRLWVSSCDDCHKGVKARIEADGIEAIDALARRLGVKPLDDPALRRACGAALADR